MFILRPNYHYILLESPYTTETLLMRRKPLINQSINQSFNQLIVFLERPNVSTVFLTVKLNNFWQNVQFLLQRKMVNIVIV